MPHADSPFDRLRAARRNGPIVVAHRGDSRRHPENTLAAFRAARQAGVMMQEFDVQATRDGVLVCLHDEGLDRTTNASQVLGPGALVAQTDAAVIRTLDAGRWRGAAHAGERVPTLRDALQAMLPDCMPLIERKSGTAAACVQEIRAAGAGLTCIVQSFDWRFVADVHAIAPEFGLALLGPSPLGDRIGDDVILAARAAGAGMLHWDAGAIGRADVERVHAAGLLLCTYTSDDEVAWAGHAHLGVDAFCTNDPGRALAAMGRDAGRAKS